MYTCCGRERRSPRSRIDAAATLVFVLCMLIFLEPNVTVVFVIAYFIAQIGSVSLGASRLPRLTNS